MSRTHSRRLLGDPPSLWRGLTLLVAILATSACSSNARPSERRSSSNILTRDEIAAAPVATAYEALDRLRPLFLRPRPRSTSGRGSEYATVYIDGVRRGSIDVLQTIAANAIFEIRYLTASDATTRYGMGIDGGVIDVKLIRR